jgi:hypothetical protein
VRQQRRDAVIQFAAELGDGLRVFGEALLLDGVGANRAASRRPVLVVTRRLWCPRRDGRSSVIVAAVVGYAETQTIHLARWRNASHARCDH